jgi:hypothetical protein
MVSRRNQKRRQSRRKQRKSRRSQRGGGFTVTKKEICQNHAKEIKTFKLYGENVHNGYERIDAFLLYLITWQDCPVFQQWYKIEDFNNIKNNKLTFPPESESHFFILKDEEGNLTPSGRQALVMLLSILQKAPEFQ